MLHSLKDSQHEIYTGTMDSDDIIAALSLHSLIYMGQRQVDKTMDRIEKQSYLSIDCTAF